jgi:hypothetical protein
MDYFKNVLHMSTITGLLSGTEIRLPVEIKPACLLVLSARQCVILFFFSLDQNEFEIQVM